MDSASVGLHRWPWSESVEQEETRAEAAGVRRGRVRAGGSVTGSACAEPDLQPPCLGGTSGRDLLRSPACATVGL